MVAVQLDDLQRRRLRWRARRGLLENDVILTRFLDRHEHDIDLEQADALSRLLELPDNDLLDLFLARSELTGDVDTPAARALLARLRSL